MRTLLVVVVAVLAVAMVTGQDYEIQPPTLSLLTPQGLRMAIPHEDGIEIFAVHYSVNKPVVGTEPGDWNEDVTAPTGDEWVHENPGVVVNIGDTVYFWHFVIHNGLGYQLLEQEWTATDPTDPPTSAPEPTTEEHTPAPEPTTEKHTPDPEPTTEEPTPDPSTPPPPSSTDPQPGSSTAPPNTPPPVLHGKKSKSGEKRKVYNALKDKRLRKRQKATPTCIDYPCLIFQDEFDSLDLDTWEPEKTMGGGGNWEFQYYDNNRSTAYTSNGNLYLKPIPTSDKYDEGMLSSGTLSLWGHQPANLCTGNAWWGCERAGTGTNFINPVQSARLRSVQSLNFAYGKVEINARMPKGDWLWPAIWLLPTRAAYGEWPASGEIDIVESRGNLDLQDENSNQMGHTHAGAAMHWGPFLPYNGYTMTGGSADGDWADTFHDYVLEWDPDSIRVSYDSEVIMDVTPPAGGFWAMGNADWQLPDTLNPWTEGDLMAPFDKDFYLVMNVAVGGTGGFFPDTWTNAAYPKPWTNESPTGPRDFWQGNGDWLPTWVDEEAAMVVNYVRVWKMEPDADTELLNS